MRRTRYKEFISLILFTTSIILLFDIFIKSLPEVNNFSKIQLKNCYQILIHNLSKGLLEHKLSYIFLAVQFLIRMTDKIASIQNSKYTWQKTSNNEIG